jgi:hypothetical protein
MFPSAIWPTSVTSGVRSVPRAIVVHNRPGAMLATPILPLLLQTGPLREKIKFLIKMPSCQSPVAILVMSRLFRLGHEWTWLRIDLMLVTRS